MKQLMITRNKKILIIAPHPDDEIFCCSGILINYAKQCDIILLTYGEKGNPGWSENKTADIRKGEFRKVMRHLGVHKYVELKLPDGEVKENVGQLRRIPYEIYDYVFVPNRFDNHMDHNCVFRTVYLEMRIRRAKAMLCEYEMWGMIRNPTHYIDITGVIKRKKALMMLYKSQQMHINYCDRMLALNYFRAIETMQADYIECFYGKNIGDRIDLRHWLREKIITFLTTKK